MTRTLSLFGHTIMALAAMLLFNSCIVVSPDAQRGNQAPAGIHNPPQQRYGGATQEVFPPRENNNPSLRQDRPAQTDIIPTDNSGVIPPQAPNPNELGNNNGLGDVVNPDQPADPRQPVIGGADNNMNASTDPVEQVLDNGAATTATTPAAPTTEQYPYATPVAGQAGMVISPYARDKGWVDVSGIPPGTKVTDPYTGKVFLVP